MGSRASWIACWVVIFGALGSAAAAECTGKVSGKDIKATISLVSAGGEPAGLADCQCGQLFLRIEAMDKTSVLPRPDPPPAPDMAGAAQADMGPTDMAQRDLGVDMTALPRPAQREVQVCEDEKSCAFAAPAFDDFLTGVVIHRYPRDPKLCGMSPGKVSVKLPAPSADMGRGEETDVTCEVELAPHFLAPPPPVMKEVKQDGSGARPTWQPSTGAVAHQVMCRASETDAPLSGASPPLAYSLCRPDGLLSRGAPRPSQSGRPVDMLDPAYLCPIAEQQGKPYLVVDPGSHVKIWVVAVDRYGNATSSREEIKVDDDIIVNPQLGGCDLASRSGRGAASGALLLGAGLLLGALRWGRRRLRLRPGALVLLAAACALQPGAAGAARALIVNIKLGVSAPQLDNPLSEVPPPMPVPGNSIASLFGADGRAAQDPLRWQLLSQLEIDYLPLSFSWGQLGAGVSVGYAQISGHQFLRYSLPSGGDAFCRLERGAYRTPAGASASFADCTGETNTLRLLPLNFLLMLRVDALETRYGVPLHFYVKGGVAYTPFWLSGPKLERSGASQGLVLLPGLALSLGAIDRSAMAILRREARVQRVLLLAELSYAWMNGFGKDTTKSGAPLNLNDFGFNTGLAFEF